MTLQERQDKEIEALKREMITEAQYANIEGVINRLQPLIEVISDPETYFKNIDEDETNNS
jgi:hypothetical protein